MILIGEPCIFNLYNLCQTGSSYIRQESVHFISMNKQALNFFYDNLLLGQSSSSYFAVERADKTLHRMSLCTPVNVPTKITWQQTQNVCASLPLSLSVWPNLYSSSDISLFSYSGYLDKCLISLLASALPYSSDHDKYEI